MKYFDAEADGTKVKVSIKKNAATFFENRAGIFILVTSSDVTWDHAMSAYDVRRLTEQAYNHAKEDDNRVRTSNKERLIGRLLIRFVALAMKCEIAARIRESEMANTLDIQTCIDNLNTIEAWKYGDTARLSEVTKKCRDICEALRIDVPRTVIEGTDIGDNTSPL